MTSKTDPFGWGVDVIIGCSSTQVCSACTAWDLIQSHWVKWASPAAPFFQLSSWPFSRDMIVAYIKGLLAKLGLSPSSYSRHSLCIGGYHSHCCWPQGLGGQVSRVLEEQHILDIYKRDDRHEGWLCQEDGLCPRAFNYSRPYPVKDKL